MKVVIKFTNGVDTICHASEKKLCIKRKLVELVHKFDENRLMVRVRSKNSYAEFEPSVF